MEETSHSCLYNSKSKGLKGLTTFTDKEKMRKEFKGVNVLPLMAEEAIRAVRRERVDYNNLILLQCVVEKYTIQR